MIATTAPGDTDTTTAVIRIKELQSLPCEGATRGNNGPGKANRGGAEVPNTNSITLVHY